MSSKTTALIKAGEAIASVARRFDGWRNFLTGLGSWGDKSLASVPMNVCLLSPVTLQSLFAGNDFARRIVATLPTETFKQGFALNKKGAEPTEVQDEADELLTTCEQDYQLSERFEQGMTWGRLHGFGALVLGVEGSGAPEEPLDDEAVTAIRWLMVVDKRDLVPFQYYDDPEAEKYGEVATYTLQPAGTQTGTLMQGVVIHETRVIVFGGTLTSRRDRIRNQMTDHSVLQPVYEVLQQADSNWSGVCHLMTDVSQAVFKIKDLAQIIASEESGHIDTRMRLMDQSRSVARAIVIGEEEEFTRVATPLGGVPEIIEKTWQRLAAAAEMPLTVLMGVSPAGLNATGASDIRLWYDRIKKTQAKITPQLERVVRMIARVEGYGDADTWGVSWPSLWQMSASEKADYRLKMAQADNFYVQMGALLPEEVALSRFAHGPEYQADVTSIDVDARNAALKQAIDELKNPTPDPVPLPPGSGGQRPPQDAQRLNSADKPRPKAVARAPAPRSDGDQPRVPAGSPEGGEFASLTHGDVSGAEHYAGHSHGAVLRAHETEIAPLLRENVVVLGKDDREPTTNEGSSTRVKGRAPRGGLVDAVVTHNHPTSPVQADSGIRHVSPALSVKDAMSAAKANVAEIRAVGQVMVNGEVRTVVHSLKKTGASWRDPAIIKAAYDAVENRARVHLATEIAAGRGSREEHGQQHDHLTWKHVAASLGLRYQRVIL